MVAALAIVAIGSRWPWLASLDEVALVRLDWRARGERVEECRAPRDEEIAELPVHMRPREICESKIAPYTLVVTLDGAVVIDDTIHGAGAREDRPLYVAREIAVSPGPHYLHIGFEKIGFEKIDLEKSLSRDAGAEDEEDGDEDDDGEAGDEAEDDEDGHEEDGRPGVHAADVSPSLWLAGTFRLAPRQVLVVTYDPDRRSLVASAQASR